MAEEALNLCIEEMHKAGEPIPAPSSLDAVLADPDFADGAFLMVAARGQAPAHKHLKKARTVANIIYIEARPKGRPEGTAIEDYVVEDHADHVLGTFRTQREAIEWAQTQGYAALVPRGRHLSDKKKPDHWRAVAAADARPVRPH
jgi:hypothetical protein